MGSNIKSCDHEEEELTEIVWDYWVKKKWLMQPFPHFLYSESGYIFVTKK